jgi:uncharacterized membrane protein
VSGRAGRFAELRDFVARRIAPPRFVLFTLVTCAGAAGWHLLRQSDGWQAFAAGFDIGVIAFALSLLPLRKDRGQRTMREHSARNDANRGLVLVLTAGVVAAILVAIRFELPSARSGHALPVAGLIATLLLAWIFANLVFMLHYAHMHYALAPDGQSHLGGFEFPGTPEPDYGDFLYFAVTAGMSFAASDVDVTRGAVRRVVVGHCLLSFLFNIGVLAFSINVLAGVATSGGGG